MIWSFYDAAIDLGIAKMVIAFSVLFFVCGFGLFCYLVYPVLVRLRCMVVAKQDEWIKNIWICKCVITDISDAVIFLYMLGGADLL